MYIYIYIYIYIFITIYASRNAGAANSFLEKNCDMLLHLLIYINRVTHLYCDTIGFWFEKIALFGGKVGLFCGKIRLFCRKIGLF